MKSLGGIVWRARGRDSLVSNKRPSCSLAGEKNENFKPSLVLVCSINTRDMGEKGGGLVVFHEAEAGGKSSGPCLQGRFQHPLAVISDKHLDFAGLRVFISTWGPL